MSRVLPTDHLVWEQTVVNGRRVKYGVAGEGLPVLFLHGWGLGSHSYKRALKRLVRQGCRVYAPALPGFGGTSKLPGRGDLGGYAAWADGFLDAVGVDEPVLAVGHSFGGAVATKLAHDFPTRVGYLVLINAVGGGTWRLAGGKVRSMAERPLWDWAVNFPRDILFNRSAVRTISAILEDAVPNFVGNPLGVWQVADVARRADLTADLQDLAERRLPVLALWGEGDLIIPRASFEAICEAVGCAGEVVPGRHSWLLANPDTFGQVMAKSVDAANAARAASRYGGQARAG
ncbi:MAG TPA: alpha/beta fold hydrolase [Acidimicrobiales bacterium]|nr:alpha/beta fold hydrolase [Acidimicrobiales bacterium]